MRNIGRAGLESVKLQKRNGPLLTGGGKREHERTAVSKDDPKVL